MSSVTDDGECFTGSNDENLLLLYKELKFEHKRHRDDVLNKCAEFWRYIYSRPDIQPVSAKQPAAIMELNNVSNELGHQCEKKCTCNSKCDRTHQRWLATILAIHKINCSNIQMNSDTPCTICEENQKIFDGLFTNESSKNSQFHLEQNRELGEWQEDSKTMNNKMYEFRPRRSIKK